MVRIAGILMKSAFCLRWVVVVTAGKMSAVDDDDGDISTALAKGFRERSVFSGATTGCTRDGGEVFDTASYSSAKISSS